MKRAIQREIQNPLALAILEGDYGEGDTIRVVLSSDGQRVEFVRVPAAGTPDPVDEVVGRKR